MQDLPFEIPDTWSWTKVSGLFLLQTGASFKKETAMADKSQTRVLRGGNIQKGTYLFLDNDIFIKNELVSSNIYLRKNDLITPAVTSLENIGKIARITEDYDYVTVGGFVFILRAYYNNDILSKYLYYAIQSEYFTEKLKYITKASGSAFFNINKERFLQLLLPIPPESEQTQIVSFLEEAFTFIDLIEKNQEDYSVLTESLKKAILKSAIQGTLVEQDENDEPASILLERIRAEKKAQLGKKYVESYIYKGDDNRYYEKNGGETQDVTDELPFDIPFSWMWIKVGNLFRHNTGKALNASDTKGELKQYITTSNLYWGKFELNELKEMPFTAEQYEKCSVKRGDLLVCEGGDIGRAAIWEFDYPMCIQNHIHRLRPYVDISVKFYFYIFMLYKQLGLIGGKGIGIQGLSTNALAKMLFPLPPLNEQYRIVKKIDFLFNMLKDED